MLRAAAGVVKGHADLIHLSGADGGTGATDNAIGCAVMMEAARILKALGVKPRRTIRVVLWGAEEKVRYAVCAACPELEACPLKGRYYC